MGVFVIVFFLLFNVFRRFLFLLRNWFRVHLWRKMIKIYIFWIIGTNIFHILEKSLGNNFPTLATGPSTSYVIILVKSGNMLTISNDYVDYQISKIWKLCLIKSNIKSFNLSSFLNMRIGTYLKVTGWLFICL